MTARVVSLSAVLRRMGACREARSWVRATRNARFADTWAACERGDWMLWLAVRVRPHLPAGAYRAYRSAINAYWATPHWDRSTPHWARSTEQTRAHLPASVMERAILAWWEAQS